MAGGLGGLNLEAPKATNATASVGGHDGGGKELRPVWKVLGRTARRVLGAIQAARAPRECVHMTGGAGRQTSKEVDKEE